jgi:tetraprenyl-beta-curcumene synthase
MTTKERHCVGGAVYGADFRQLHQAMLDAVTPGVPPGDYNRHRGEREDGGFLSRLVQT